ncbi:hypothetical protein [Pyruvatibacter mobilis]|uniref:hypothetical protein n=1 Tax=Pyruvatibacter mobilis TaxID=1712261 RepID=UPI003BB0981A
MLTAKEQYEMDMLARQVTIQNSQTKISRNLANVELYRTVVQPIEADRARLFDAGTDLFKLALQSAFVLNGGALVALPALAAIPGALDADQQLFSTGELLGAAAWFLFGFVLAAAATLFGGLSFRALSGSRAEERNKEAEFVNASSDGREPPEFDETALNKFNSRAQLYYYMALVNWIGSYLVFSANTLVLIV